MREIKRFLALCLCVLAVCSLFGCRQTPKAQEQTGYGLFSWRDAAVTQPEQLLELAGRAGVTQLYQACSSKLSPGEIGAFVAGAQARGIGVYYLAGDAQWGLEADGENAVEAVRRAAQLNRGMQTPFQGVMLDVEPYLTQEWDEDRDDVMERYVSAMERAYREAKAQNLPLVLCIPYFYDTKGQSEQLARLIANACDAIAIMNYQKKDEAGQIAFEAETAAAYGKGVIHIYELQAPGEHDLTERNTYYADGLEAVHASRERLLARFPGASLSFALHDDQALKELMRNE